MVRPILEAVRKRGDRALLEYARQFDGSSARACACPERNCSAARERSRPQFRRRRGDRGRQHSRLRRSARCRASGPRKSAPGLRLGQIVRPLDTVAAYIPAGRYPLPSTVMMTVIPGAGRRRAEHLRGVSRSRSREVFGTAALLGVRQVFQMGGAQAIAAFAFGTRTVPRADRIVGPGNIYVAAAKKLLAGEVGIDFVAGPTEILIIAADGDPRHFAADMLAQAEHDVDASAILLTTSKRLAAAVAGKSSGSWPTFPPPRWRASRSRRTRAIILVRTLDEAVEISNRFAPEHLSIPDASLLAGVRHAGSVFVGPYSPEAAGDYASRPESRAADQRRRPPARRPLGHRLPEGDLGAGTEPSARCARLAPVDHDAGAGRRPRSPRPQRRM